MIHLNQQINQGRQAREVFMKMFKTQLTVGLNDKLTEKQEVKTSDAKMIIADTLLKEFGLFAFTMFTCEGVYTMASTGNTVFENSIRVEIATEDAVDTPAICYNCYEK